MDLLETRQQINQYLDQLSPEKLLVVADFLADLVEKEATQELLKIKGFKEAFEKAKMNVQEGKVISIEQLKRKYYPKLLVTKSC